MFANFSLRALSSITGQRLILPFYHTVSNVPLPHLEYLYPVKSVKNFEKDIQFLLRNYKAISANDVLSTDFHDIRSFHISFDDGFAECYHIIAPVLKKYGVPATFFVSPAFIDNNNLMYRCKASYLLYRFNTKPLKEPVLKEIAKMLGVQPTTKNLQKALLSLSFHESEKIDTVAQLASISFTEYLQRQKPYLSTGQIIELSEQGFSIGSHSNDHAVFTSISANEQIRQISTSLNWIHEKINQQLRLFSFPFTDDGLNIDFFKMVHKEISPPLNLLFGTAGMKNEIVPFLFQRIAAEKPCHNINETLAVQYVKYIVKAALSRNLSKRA